MSEWQVECLEADAISESDGRRCAALSELVWPPPQPSSDPKYASAPPPEISFPRSQRARTFVVRDDGRIVAKASFRPRQVATSAGPQTVLALAGVLCHPDYRGRGLGRAVVSAALGRVDAGEFGWALFQTGVPDFYRKLGCRVFDQPLVNSLAERRGTRPFWDKWAIVYPAAAAIPPGPVDTLGPGW